MTLTDHFLELFPLWRQSKNGRIVGCGAGGQNALWKMLWFVACAWAAVRAELLRCLSFCLRLPSGFVELSLADQINLLKCCWLEILMLGLMWRSVDHPGKLIFSPDFKLNR